MSETIVHCRGCGKKLYRVASSSKDKPSECPYCHSVDKFYLTHGEAKENTHTVNMLKKHEKGNE